MTNGLKEFKLSQYADYTTAFLSDTKSATNLFKLLSNLQECSGLEINKRKTEGMWLGASRKNTLMSRIERSYKFYKFYDFSFQLHM